MTLPPAIRADVERVLAESGLGSRVVSYTPIPGGCINRGGALDTDAGERLFLKWNPRPRAGMFEAEADGLTAIRETGSVRVPAPVAWQDGGQAPAWLLMEFIPATPASSSDDETLGSRIALMHDGASPDAGWGWRRDNWIGSLPQRNAPGGPWGTFWIERRIRPQVRLARRRGQLEDRVFDRLEEVVPEALEDVRAPALLHGDLWSGNAYTGPGAEPVLVDPAVYLGDAEVDLAMTELFGGFGPGFYEAYTAVRPLSDGYRAYRRDLYQLYYLAVHVNLFGRSYVADTLRAAKRVVTALA